MDIQLIINALIFITSGIVSILFGLVLFIGWLEDR